MGNYSFETTADVVAADYSATIKGKVILVTGVSPGGLGAEFALTIAKHSPCLLILAGRNPDKVQATVSAIKASAPSVPTRELRLDLGSLAAVREAAKEVNAYQEHIDILVNNAAIMARPFSLSVDGIESQFATNHVGHFLFTNLIINKLISGGQPGKGSRVVSVASAGYRISPVRFEDWNFDDGKNYNRWVAYGQAKTANMLFAKSLASRFGQKGLVAVSLHPGAIWTNLQSAVSEDGWEEVVDIDRKQGHRQFWGGFTFKTVQQGAATHVFASVSESISVKENNGAYLEDSRVAAPEEVLSWGRDEVDAEKLWKLSEQLVGQQFGH